MSLAASRVALTHRTTIERDTASVDDWGQPGSPAWEGFLFDVPCYVTTQAEREPVSVDRTIVVEDLRAIIELDTDVTERDRLGDVVCRGDTLYEGPLGIEAVLRYPTHKELMLRRIG